MRNIFLYSVILLLNLSCLKEATNKTTNYFNLIIGGSTQSGSGFIVDLPFDESNAYSLSDKTIYFSGKNNTCFHFGGKVSFTQNLSKIDYIGGYDPSCGGYYNIENDGRTYSNVTITRNDNRIGGIIEGKINGVCKRCEYNSVNCGREYFYNFEISFKLLIEQ